MQLTDWIPSGITGIAILSAAWLARNLITARLTASVQHEFDKKIEEIRSQLRVGEENVAAGLRARDAQFEALRGGAMAAMISRQVETDKRRLHAVEQIWASVMSLNEARRASRFLSSLNFEEIAKLARTDEKVRRFIDHPFFQYDPKSIKGDAGSARPFVTPMVWAIYSALFSVSTHSPMVMEAIRSGVDPNQFIKTEPMRRLVAAALPFLAADIAKVTDHGWWDIYIEPLEKRLLDEFRIMMDGRASDEERVSQAAAITSAAENLLRSRAEQPSGSAADAISSGATEGGH